MAYKISDECINCGACEGECPVNAISESDNKRIIDADACISCGACAAVCPVDCISEERSVQSFADTAPFWAPPYGLQQ